MSRVRAVGSVVRSLAVASGPSQSAFERSVYVV